MTFWCPEADDYIFPLSTRLIVMGEMAPLLYARVSLIVPVLLHFLEEHEILCAVYGRIAEESTLSASGPPLVLDKNGVVRVPFPFLIP